MTFISRSLPQRLNLLRGFGVAPCYQSDPAFENYIMVEKITPKKFALIVDELVRTKHLTHMEAIIYYCEQNVIEPDTITKWIDRSLKEKLQADAEALNYLPKTASLPL